MLCDFVNFYCIRESLNYGIIPWEKVQEQTKDSFG